MHPNGRFDGDGSATPGQVKFARDLINQWVSAEWDRLYGNMHDLDRARFLIQRNLGTAAVPGSTRRLDYLPVGNYPHELYIEIAQALFRAAQAWLSQVEPERMSKSSCSRFIDAMKGNLVIAYADARTDGSPEEIARLINEACGREVVEARASSLGPVVVYPIGVVQDEL